MIRTPTGSMSTPSPRASLEAALGGIPSNLRSRLTATYAALKKAQLQREHDAVGLRAGKLAEVLVRVLQERLTGHHSPLGTRLPNFADQCALLEKTPATAGPDSLRILMPRALSFLYTMRNKRDIGHVGGDVDANLIDAETMVRVADWCISELVRVFHNLPIEDAQSLCDALAERRLPWVWRILGKSRVLDTSLSYADQTLLLLYSHLDVGVPTEDLFAWTEHSRSANYRRDVLGPLHQRRFIEWDRETEMAILSPTGIRDVESRLLPSLTAAVDA